MTHIFESLPFQFETDEVVGGDVRRMTGVTLLADVGGIPAGTRLAHVDILGDDMILVAEWGGPEVWVKLG